MWKKTLRSIILFMLALGICLSAAYAGSAYTTPAIQSWYDHLQKPDITPPSWVFGPVWTFLYCLMAVSLYLIFQSGIRNREALFALFFFIAQLFFNVAWSYIFFGLHSTFFGLMCIIALWFLILCTMVQAFRVTAAAGAILIPYFIWVSFAAILNYLIMTMNPVNYILF